MKMIVAIATKGLAVLALVVVALLGVSFVPTLLGYESFIVTSGSMGKAVPTGSVAVTRMVDMRSVRKGDVVSFQTGSASRITHRVIAVDEEEGQRIFTTKGDANSFVDPEPVRLSSGRISRVEWSVPFAGYVVRYARTPIGGILLFAVPILGLILGAPRSRQRRRLVVTSVAAIPRIEVTTSSIDLSCPHCGEPVAMGLAPLHAETAPFNGQAASTPDVITLAEPEDWRVETRSSPDVITLAEPEDWRVETPSSLDVITLAEPEEARVETTPSSPDVITLAEAEDWRVETTPSSPDVITHAEPEGAQADAPSTRLARPRHKAGKYREWNFTLGDPPRAPSRRERWLP